MEMTFGYRARTRVLHEPGARGRADDAVAAGPPRPWKRAPRRADRGRARVRRPEVPGRVRGAGPASGTAPSSSPDSTAANVRGGRRFERLHARPPEVPHASRSREGPRPDGVDVNKARSSRVTVRRGVPARQRRCRGRVVRRVPSSRGGSVSGRRSSWAGPSSRACEFAGEADFRSIHAEQGFVLGEVRLPRGLPASAGRRSRRSSRPTACRFEGLLDLRRRSSTTSPTWRGSSRGRASVRLRERGGRADPGPARADRGPARQRGAGRARAGHAGVRPA